MNTYRDEYDAQYNYTNALFLLRLQRELRFKNQTIQSILNIHATVKILLCIDTIR